MNDQQIAALALKSNLVVHMERLNLAHPQAGKVDIQLVDPAGQNAGELFLSATADIHH